MECPRQSEETEYFVGPVNGIFEHLKVSRFALGSCDVEGVEITGMEIESEGRGGVWSG